ncbi:hypothetical protein [Actinoplanes sp. DH11]|uniref:hypothetical protein n=1 Tax=Actinoplanes sp. DH11 TaxID=2857011 RepID=UPI001E34BB0F|nr:hypothetical protein [Actinoplanes sp. DH11]
MIDRWEWWRPYGLDVRTFTNNTSIKSAMTCIYSESRGITLGVLFLKKIVVGHVSAYRARARKQKADTIRDSLGRHRDTLNHRGSLAGPRAGATAGVTSVFSAGA